VQQSQPSNPGIIVDGDDHSLAELRAIDGLALSGLMVRYNIRFR
jgi:hypothetical protein